ncbi:VirB8/TrbF family protein, partial [Salmonella enterica subsp. enterica serovar Montevideo]|nr:VirB8/TrbF family protein [Salmonella enterica subsp. enterica serovar Montevideo]
FFGILAFASVIAVMGLTPLKTVETTIIRVDRNSGYMDVIRPGNNSNFGSEPASAGFFISVAIAAISAANLPPPTIKKGLAIRQP